MKRTCKWISLFIIVLMIMAAMPVVVFANGTMTIRYNTTVNRLRKTAQM